jgi:hypothetical protein
MILAPLLLTALGPSTVDMTLTPAAQCSPVNSIIEVDLVLSAGGPAAISAFDAIITWDPAELEFLQAITGGGGWFVSGFLNDPDGINADLTDGDALFTGLANPASPVMLPPALVAVTFRFRVLDSGKLHLTPALGAFGETKVLGLVPGQVLTGTLSGPASVFTATAPSIEVSRLGTPPNPDAFKPGVTSGPVIGQVWDPFVDHSSFLPGAILDALFMTLAPVNLPVPPHGTLLCLPPIIVGPLTGSPGTPFVFPIPNDCVLVGIPLCTQAFSLDAVGNALLTNALDITLGSF